MSEQRVSDEDLIGMSTWPVDIEPDTAEVSHRLFQSLVAELRERRASDLDGHDIKALRAAQSLIRTVLRERLTVGESQRWHSWLPTAVDVLDKLIDSKVR